jgi:hypothetical protein
MGKPKGAPKTGGRVKGTPNKVTAQIKDAIMAAYDRLGGVEYLVRVGEEHPVVFCALLGKLLPNELRLPAEELAPLVRIFTSKTEDKGVVIDAEAQDQSAVAAGNATYTTEGLLARSESEATGAGYALPVVSVVPRGRAPER